MEQVGAKRMPLWREKQEFQRTSPSLSGVVTADVVVVGGGMVGLMTAWNLQAKGVRVVVLEKNAIITGDSGATTGFLTCVPDTSVASLAAAYGPGFVKKIFGASRSAQERLFALIKNENIDCAFASCETLEGSYAQGDEHVKREWNVLEQVGEGEFIHGIAGLQPFQEAIRFRREGKMNAPKFLLAVAEKLAKANVTIFEESDVQRVDVDDASVRVFTDGGEVRAHKVILATGYPIQPFAELQKLVKPFLTFVVAAHFPQGQCSENLFVDTLDPYFYFRSVDASTLICGGCDVPADERGKSGEAFLRLHEFVRGHFGGDFTVTHEWSGSIFHTSDGLPYVFEHPAYRGRVYTALGFAGNGLVFGALAAELLASLATSKSDERAELFSPGRTGVKIDPPVKVNVERADSQKQWATVARVNDIVEGQPLCAAAGEKKIAVFKVGNDFFAIDNTCSHAGGPLCEGMLEGATIQCPLHGAQFDVRTGHVLGPPAVRKQSTYRTRVNGDHLEVEFQPITGNRVTGAPSRKRQTYWRSLVRFACFAFGFWGIEFFLQYFWLTEGELGGSFVRSFALSGATFVSCALFASALFKWVPRWAKYWRLRRYLGVTGFVFITFHVLSVYYFLFQFDLRSAYYSFNPLENPIIFGSFAFPILLVMALTSTDWAVHKLTAKRWKMIHRFVYLAYWGVVFHFLFINPSLLQNPPGYVLLVITALALLGELYWYVTISAAKKFRTWGALVGGFILLLYIVTAVLMYEKRFADQPAEPVEEPLSVAESVLQGNALQRGTFQSINYMTSGGATLEEKDGKTFVGFDETFETPNGPDLVVYLTKNTAPTSRSDIVQGIQLGELKSLKGRQMYEVPSGTDFDDFKSVSIHCRAFNVPWSYAAFK